MTTDSSDVTAGTNATVTHYNNLRHDIVLGKGNVGTASDGATVTFDFSDSTKGNVRTVTLGGNRTLAVSNVGVGQKFIIRLKQDGTGSRTVNWFDTINWDLDIEPVLTTTINKVDVFGFICTATDTYDGYVLGMGKS